MMPVDAVFITPHDWQVIEIIAIAGLVYFFLAFIFGRIINPGNKKQHSVNKDNQ